MSDINIHNSRSRTMSKLMSLCVILFETHSLSVASCFYDMGSDKVGWIC